MLDRKSGQRIDDGNEMSHIGNYLGVESLSEVGGWLLEGLENCCRMDKEADQNLIVDGRDILRALDGNLEVEDLVVCMDRYEGQTEKHCSMEKEEVD